MQSHRRPRGKIAFESFCAVCVGASFVGAWVQTGAWAFLGPAFLFTLFGLYWLFDLSGDEPVEVAAMPVPALGIAAPPAMANRAEGLEPPLIGSAPGPAIVAEITPDVELAVAAVTAEAADTPKAKPKKSRTKKMPPVSVPEPIALVEDAHPEPHIEQLFDTQPFVRQARPAFGKRPRGPGARPLPA